MAIPETDLDRIHLWCRERWPEDMWHQAKVEADVADRHVDIVEVRPAWDGVGQATREPVARLRYPTSSGQWAIYWCDSNLKFHAYKYKRPSKNVQILLDHIENSGDPIFWGEAINWQVSSVAAARDAVDGEQYPRHRCDCCAR